MASQAAEVIMPQFGAAQREPSMEEILASIRRIIEDSDTAKRTASDALPTPANSAGAPEIEAFRQELRPSPGGQDSPRLQRLAQLEIASNTVEPLKAPEESTQAADAAGLQPASEDVLDLDMELGISLEDDDISEPVAAAHAAPTEPAESPATASTKPAILSDQTGRQVAAAFGELSEAFAASRRRSFDEMAEEMMRPMLQDWLDNNLPKLVERLVREEIERVARGPAR
jgi:uncharacterized protein